MSVWNELVGQERAVDQLARAAAAGSTAMTHAWLLTGPPGSGRSNAARAFAAALLTPDAGDSDSPEAQRALRGIHESMTVLSTQKSLISIDEVRALVATAHQGPVNADWRVVIIEDADRMAERTSNVLLKAIEEPPPSTVWILCAPSPEDVLTTIRSRCRNVNLRIPSPDAVAQLLRDRDGADADTARWAAHAAQSHIGRARRLVTSPNARSERTFILDIPRHLTSVGSTIRIAARIVDVAKDRAKARTEERNAQEKEQLLRTLGIEAGGKIPPSARSQIRRLEEEQKRRDVRARNDELDSIFIELLSLYRDVLAAQLGADTGTINVDEDERIGRLAAEGDSTATLKRIDVLRQARERLATNMASALVVEAAFVGLSNPWITD
ncbi:MAG: DNA polymerase III subunit delta' [Brevibacterium yomogidense]|uniref:DNA polymerase III delta prime subunit n=1 Tax=Brevibacterium yomogidense TaxID=946573 RepID=A0A1X6XDV6_9MICO|nr:MULTISPECIES: DNA polymerase III subunit delta' [Brevibacterium]SLM97422.1 DNA polymerase III delta prime subunit [Brevibacterium yomogidense]SMX64505.1 DNA polymerase-3 subunit delta' [Brevibacterium sp. Mu109]